MVCNDSRIPRRARRFLRFALLALLCTIGGCNPAASPLATGPGAEAAVSIDRDQFTYEAGEVLAGVEVNGQFTVKNDGTEEISIREDTDIKLHCGCCRVAPESKTIGPGGSTTVSVCLDTSGRSGKFSTGGSIVWSSPSGGQRTTHFTVNAAIRPPLQVDPEALHFSEDDLKAERFKELRVRSLAALDWDKLQVGGESPALRFRPRKREGDTVVLSVSCQLDAGIESLQTAVTLVGRVTDPKSPLAGKDTAVRVPITAQRRIDLAISPKTILPTQRDGKMTAALLVHGRRLADDSNAIRAIRGDRGQVSWTLSKPTSSGTALLTLIFDGNERPTAVEVDADGIERIRIPVVWPDATSLKKGG